MWNGGGKRNIREKHESRNQWRIVFFSNVRVSAKRRDVSLVCCARLLIDDRWSAHGRFARAYKRVAHALMKNTGGGKREVSWQTTTRVYPGERLTYTAEGEGYLMAGGMRMGGKIPSGEEAGWWERVGRPADVAILRECLNRDHVVNPPYTSPHPVPLFTLAFLYTIVCSSRVSRVHIRRCVYMHLFTCPPSLLPFRCFTFRRE